MSEVGCRIMTDRNVRRWRLVRCFRNENKTERESEAQRYVEQLKVRGYPSKIYVPLPQHQTSGHTHVVALCNLFTKLSLGGVELAEFCPSNKVTVASNRKGKVEVAKKEASLFVGMG